MRVFQVPDQVDRTVSTRLPIPGTSAPGNNSANSSSGFFFQLHSDLQSSLRNNATVCHFKRNEMILQSGENGGALYILLEGSVKVFRKSSERKLCLSVLLPGDCFGELSMIDSLEVTADIMATEPGNALMISRKAFFDILQTHPAFQRDFLCYLSSKMRNTIEDVCSIALDDVYRRLRRVLYRLATGVGSEQQVQNITHLEISEMVGASREMVSIIIKELRLGGYIETAGKTITIRKTLPEKR